MVKNKPVIGITLDYQEAGGYSLFSWYALRENYFSAVEMAGGIPIAIPYCMDAVPHYLNLINGLMIPGGAHDINPKDYGDDWCHEKVLIKDHRTQFDKAILKGALERQKPFLGICAGLQVLNIIRKGTLIQHIPDAVENHLMHELSHAPDQSAHTIKISKNTLLYEIAGIEEAWVNSTHHQAIKNIGENLHMNAIASDGVIEGIEDPGLPFCLGVEWHPEYCRTEFDHAIFKRFIAAASLDD